MHSEAHAKDRTDSRPYEAPSVVELGALHELTLGGAGTMEDWDEGLFVGP